VHSLRALARVPAIAGGIIWLFHVKTINVGSEKILKFIKIERPLKNAQFFSRSRKARILTTGIPVVFRGLEFESDAACPAIAS
jgi:hypothetical protein